MKILIKFPTRSRREKFFKVLDMYYSFANNLDLIHFQISIDEDDPTMNNDEVISKFGTYKNLTCTVGKSENKIHAVNRDIIVGDWDIVLLASDDMIPKIKGYDDIATTTENEIITFIFQAYNGFTERNEDVAEIDNETDGNRVLRSLLNDVLEEDEFRRWRNMTDVSSLIRGWLRQYFPGEIESDDEY
jgi:hypothetical protein